MLVIKIRVSQHSRSLAAPAPSPPFLFASSPCLYFLPPSYPTPTVLIARHLSFLFLYSSCVLLSTSFFLLSPLAPAPSLTQGPCVPVCNISKAVRQPGQGKQPSTGFRGDGGPRCFSSGTRGPLEISDWGQGGAKGEDNPLSCPLKNIHNPGSFAPLLDLLLIIFFFLVLVSFCICVHTALQQLHLLIIHIS